MDDERLWIEEEVRTVFISLSPPLHPWLIDGPDPFKALPSPQSIPVSHGIPTMDRSQSTDQLPDTEV